MKILVTGGAGFIGSQVVDAYLAAGHQVAVLDNLSTGKRENLNPAARFVEMDLNHPAVGDFLAQEKFQVVNHHAAQVSVPYSVAHPELDMQSNGLGMLNLLQASVRSGVERFIFISSGGAVYGEQEQIPTQETALPKPLSPYAAHKLLGESYLHFYGKQYGLKHVVLRYANVYGPRQSPHAEAGVVAIFCERLLAGQPCVIYRHQDMPAGMLRDYVYVGDIVRSNLAALDAGLGETVNIGTGRATSTAELYDMIAEAAGSHLKPSYGPPRSGDIRRSLLDCAKARQALGWQAQVDLAEGCRRTMEWYRQRLGK